MLKSGLLLSHTPIPIQPVTGSERIAALDILRGFAMGGVLFAYTLWSLGGPPEDALSTVDRVLNGVLLMLVDTKFYTLLAFLFGVGFSLQMTRVEAGGGNIVKLYCRRLSALLLIGLAHALLLRNGDILVPYAVMGLVLLLFRQASNRVLLAGIGIGLIYPSLARAAWELTGLPFPRRPAGEGLSHLAENFAWVRYWYSTAIVYWPGSLPMFLLGLYAGRQRWFEHLAVHRQTLRRLALAGFCAAVLAYLGRLWIWFQMPPPFAKTLLLNLLSSAQTWGLSASYASVLLLLVQRPTWQPRLAWLGAVGRMALTNYLLQAALIVPICLGFGLFDRVTPRLAIVLALAVWSLQVPFSVWWLRRFRFGPAEWLWRLLTYGKLQSMRMEIREALSPGFKQN